MRTLHGTGVALVTPFKEDGSLDLRSMTKVLRHTGKGVDYYVVMGTTGESSTATLEERQTVLRFVQANNPKQLPIVYGLGGNNTAKVIEEIRETDLSGVDALLSVSPYYNKPSQEGIHLHFRAIADASPLPLILYNVPGRTSTNMTAATTLRLARHKRIIGIKEASGNMEQCLRIARDRPDGFLLLSGDDMMTLAIYAIGGEGVISVLANAFPVEFRRMKEHCLKKNYERARESVFRILDLNASMYEEGSPVGVKYLLSCMGLCESHTRLPHAPPSAALQAKIRAAYQRVQTKKG